MKLTLSKLTVTVLMTTASLFEASCKTGPDLSDLNERTPANVKTSTKEQELSGVYKVSGSNENRGRPCEGSLTVENKEAGYRFNWQTNLGKYYGSGVQCSFALFQVKPDGDFDGRWGGQRTVALGSETAKR